MVLRTRIIKGYKFQWQQEDLNFKVFAPDNNYLTQKLPNSYLLWLLKFVIFNYTQGRHPLGFKLSSK